MQAGDPKVESLLNCGANGGIVRSNVRVLACTHLLADATGTGEHQIENLKIGNVAGVVQTQHGPVIAIMHKYAS